MPDLPKLPAVNLSESMRSVIKASQAVKSGIATHREKHVSSRREQHARLEAERKLTEQAKAQ